MSVAHCYCPGPDFNGLEVGHAHVQAARAYDAEMVRVLGEGAVLNNPWAARGLGHQQQQQAAAAAAGKLQPQHEQAPSPPSGADTGRPLSAASAASTADLARLVAPAVTPDSTGSAAPPASGAQVRSACT